MSCCRSCRGDEAEQARRAGNGARPPLVFDHICGSIEVARRKAFPIQLGGAFDVSSAIRMGCANAATASLSVFRLTGTAAASLGVEGSNDTESWVTLGMTPRLARPGILSGTFTRIGWRFIRLRYVISGNGAAFLSAGLRRWTSST
ncbi:MAG: hypothetical protein HUU15_09650 [Candidatus Brocadiae bacterium]|nr:hypothetical protein [Candidatus Brocadiia bacterium]